MAINVLDRYYLSLTLLITIAYQLFFFCIAWTLHFDKLTDFAGGTNFVVLAVITLALSLGGGNSGGVQGGGGGSSDARQILASLFIMAWGARLSGFLLFRILKTGKDDRFDDKRDKFFPFLGFWIFQMLWVWTVSLPITILNSPAIANYPSVPFGRPCDIIGIILFLYGFLLEAVADVQKYRFRSVVQKGDKSAICEKGVWGWSRHPNYFGEITLQLGLYLLALSPAIYPTQSLLPSSSRAALYSTILGPIFLTLLLLFVSGLPLQERPGAKKRYERSVVASSNRQGASDRSSGAGEGEARGDGGKEWQKYSEYLRTTSILIPMPKSVWSRLPVGIKRTVGCEWPLYVFVPERDAQTGGGGEV